MPLPEPRFSPPHGRADRALSGLTFALLLASWAVAYVAVAPAEPQRGQHVVAAPVRL